MPSNITTVFTEFTGFVYISPYRNLVIDVSQRNFQAFLHFPYHTIWTLQRPYLETMLSILFLSVLVRLAVCNPLSEAKRQQRPTTSIQVATAVPTGTGCPPNSYSLQYFPHDDFFPNLSGFTIGFDEPFFLPLRSDDAELDKNLKASRACTIQVKLKYPVGCTSATMLVASHGVTEMDVDARSSISRSYSISTGTKLDPPPVNFPGGAFFGAPPEPFSQNDSIQEKATIKSGSQDVTLSVAVTTEIHSTNRTALNFSHIQMDDITVQITVDQFSPTC